MKTFLCIFAAALFCGCVAVTPSKPTTVIGGPNDYGQYPTNYESLVTTYIKVYFKDPDSVKDLKVFEPKQIIRDDFQGTKTYCYFVMFWANAKNSYGGYTGTQTSSFYVRDGHILP
jgi:hypothetical protein